MRTARVDNPASGTPVSFVSRDDHTFAGNLDPLSRPPSAQIFPRAGENLLLHRRVLFSDGMAQRSPLDEHVAVLVVVLESHRVGLTYFLGFVESRVLEQYHHLSGSAEFVLSRPI